MCKYWQAGLEMLLHCDETLDDLRLQGLKILQKKDGYRFSLDPILLCAFARVERGDAVVDLGTGSGLIPLLLARKTGAGSIVGIEIQPELADRARRSVRLNGLEEKIEILEEDLRCLSGKMAPQSCDVILTNPPYRRFGSGRQAPQAERALARHEMAGGLDDFLMAASYLLRNAGRFYIIYLAERLGELLALMRERKLEPKRLRCVHSRREEQACMVLVEGRKGGRTGLSVEGPLFVYDGEGYSAEVLSIYGEGRFEDCKTKG
jgi:tRNA1Val (adenine37-N6)-methyltransferase